MARWPHTEFNNCSRLNTTPGRVHEEIVGQCPFQELSTDQDFHNAQRQFPESPATKGTFFTALCGPE
jgi:hypothetical protein